MADTDDTDGEPEPTEDLPVPEPGGTSSPTSAEGPHARAGPRVAVKRGAAIGRYIVLDVLGAGGMGLVYLAIDPELDRKVAIKLMRRQTPEGHARLVREAQAMARVQHPNVVAVHDLGNFGDHVFVAMDYIDGSTLTEWLAAEKRSWREIVRVLIDAGQGVVAAHAAGVVHRDLKPDNILVDKEQRVYVTDFGLARSVAGGENDAPAQPGRRAETPSARLDAQVTRADMIIGTPGYMAPEQVAGKAADERTDQFGFATTLYEALYGAKPPGGQPNRAPASLRRIVMRGIEPAPEDRYSSMAELLAAMRATHAPDFGPRYRVIGVLGRGGMGEVYHAYDTDIRAEVALKIVHTDHAEVDAYERFRREIALARKVTDPNVLRVYDLGEHEGLRFLSMEYVHGESLASLLRREKLPLDRVLAIFRQVASGLAAAHAQGVVHRDLKPQNVLLDKAGRVRVADFGLARSVGESSLTASGAVLGSPAYMSPEQVKGDPIDARSDIYSLGIMLYQLVTRRAPFQADTPHAVMEMRLHKKPAPLRQLAPDVPAQLEAVAARCLELDPDRRYQSIRALLADLDRGEPPRAPRRKRVVAIGAGIAVVAATATIAIVKSGAEKPRPAAVVPPAVTPVVPTGPVRTLVLGIENRTGDPVFDGTLDTVLQYALRRSPRVDPLAGADVRQLATTFGGDARVDEELGRQLAARDKTRVLVVRGHVVAHGAGFVVTLDVSDPVTGKPIVKDSIDAASFDHVIPAMGRLASRLRAALGDSVPEDQQELTGLSPRLDAAHEFSLGYTMRLAGDLEGARTHLESAVAKDPQFALAYVQLALLYDNTGKLSHADAQRKLALKWIDRMGERDKLKFIGDYHSFVTEEYDRAVTAYEELLTKWPNDAAALNNVVLAYLGRYDARHALEAAARVRREYPTDRLIAVNFAMCELFAGEFDKAATDMRGVLARFSRVYPEAHLYIGLAEVALGHRDVALAAYASYRTSEPGDGAAADADVALAEGRLADAAKLIDAAMTAHKAATDDEGLVNDRLILAELALRKGDLAGARTAAATISGLRRRVFAAALVQVAAGDEARALAAAKRFAEDVAPIHRATAKLIEAEALRVTGKAQQAMILAREAIALVDTPQARFLFARAALDARRFAEAYAELQTCIARRGELIVDTDSEVPGLRYVVPLTYYLARAQQGLGRPDAKASYQAFLAQLHDPDANDPLAADARKRLASL